VLRDNQIVIEYLRSLGVVLQGLPVCLLESLTNAELDSTACVEFIFSLELLVYLLEFPTISRWVYLEFTDVLATQEMMRSICLVDATGTSTSTLWNINVVKAVRNALVYFDHNLIFQVSSIIVLDS
jgi:hypothetical protein